MIIMSLYLMQWAILICQIILICRIILMLFAITKPHCILLQIIHQPNICMVISCLTKSGLTVFTGFFAGKKTLPLLYDPFFKMIFNPVESRARLSELVSCILGQHVTVIEVFPDTSYAFVNSFVIMDMVVRLDDGSITNIEIQKVPYDFPAARISCYSADLVLRQFRMLQGMNEGQRNDYYDDAAAGKVGNETSQAADGSSSKPSYENMKKVHTIIFFEKKQQFT